MKYIHRLIFMTASAVFFISGSTRAQNGGTVTSHAFAIGKGAGATGYTSLLCTSAQLAVGQSAADPICRTLSGDVTIDASGVTTIGAGKVTSSMLNANVFANPSASIGLTANNGTATTATRSDATPALSQSISPTWVGNHTFNPTSGNALSINPAANSLNKGFTVTQSGPTSGTTAGPFSFDLITADWRSGLSGAGTSQASGFRVDLNTGGPNISGGPIIGGYFNVNETVAGVTNVIDKIGVVGSCIVTIADTPGGGCYGSNPVSTVINASSINRLVGEETGTDIRTGGAANYRYNFNAANYGAAQGSTLDAAYVISNIGASTGAFKIGLALSNSLGQAPMATTGSLFKSDTAFTIANILDFSNATVTGNIWNFPNTSMNGNGEMVAADVKVKGGPASIVTGQGTIGASANNGLILQGFGASFDLQILNNAGGTACVVATGTTTLNCNTVTITNALAVSSGGTGDTGSAWSNFTPSLSCGTATFTVNSASRKTLGKTTWAQIDYTITAIGTCTNPVTFTLPNTAQNGGSINGQENINSSAPVSCLVASGSTTATCRRASNVNFAVNDRVIVSGVYQNQ